MRTRFTPLLTLAIAFIVIAAMAFVAVCDTPAYAKGAVKSDKGNSGSAGKSESSKSDSSSKSDHKSSPPPRSDSSSRSDQKSSPPPKSESSSRSSDHGSSPPAKSKAPSGSSDHRSSPPPRSDSSSGSGNSSSSRSGSVFTPRSSGADRFDSSPGFKGRVETRSPSIRTDTSETRRPPTSGSVAPKGSYRKEYADIGKIWSSRHEKRDTYYDRVRRDQRSDWDDHQYRIFPYYHVYSPSTFHYRSYCYDYYPDYSYPWVYCYYHTRIPPYCRSSRIVIVPTFVSRRLYIQVPIFIDWEDDYYLYDSYGRDLRYALSDIRRAWERGDADLIEDYLRPGSRIAVYLKGDYAYSIDAEEFYDMTRDAVETVSTRSFTFDRQSRRDRNTITAFGEHRYVDEDGEVKTAYVSYTFERYGSRWYITEVGSSPYRF